MFYEIFKSYCCSWPKGVTRAEKADESESESDSEDDMDFAEESEEDKQKKIAEKKRLAAEAAKKPKKIQKSSILMEIKPWSDEVDLDELEEQLRATEIDGLRWNASKQEEIAYGVCKLMFLITIVDDKVSGQDLDDLFGEGGAFADSVQSMDIAAWNKCG